jgi:hypothetical protein
MVQYFPIVTGSLTVSGSLLVSGGITASGGISISGSIASASYAASTSNALAAQTASYVLNAQSASNAVVAQTASYANALTVAGTLTAQTLVVQTITSSVDFVTGSTRFGTLLTNTHVFSGSVTMNPNGLFVSSSGNVGVGTTNPINGKLEVAGKYYANSSVADNIVEVINSDTTNGYGLYVRAGGTASGRYVARFKNGADTDVMFISSSGNVGIGTSNPLQTLHLQTSFAATSSVGSIIQIESGGPGGDNGWIGVQKGTGNGLELSVENRDIIFNTGASTPFGGTERMRITSGGAISFKGTSTGANAMATFTNDNSDLNIYASDASGTNKNIKFYYAGTSGAESLRITSAGATIMYNNMAVVDGLEIYDTQTYATNTGGTINFGGKYNSAGAYTLYARVSGRKENATDGNTAGYLLFTTKANGGGATERMRITSTGEVLLQSTGLLGINTSDGSDNSYLQLSAASAAGDNRGGRIYLSGNERSIDAGNIVIAAGDISSGTGSPGTIVFRTGADAEKMRINYNGRIQIAEANSSIDAKFLVRTDGDAYNIYCDAFNTYASIYRFMRFRVTSNRTTIGSIESSDGVNTVYSTTSDYRLKEDLKDFNGLEKISAIKVYDFKWKNINHRTYGVLAHELQEIIPYAVVGKKDDLEDDGNIRTQGADYSKIVPVLVKAIQELNAKFEDYKATHP